MCKKELNNIIIITSEFPPQPGGIGNHAFFLSKYLKKEGYEVTVVTNHRKVDEDLAFDVVQNFKINRIRRNIFTYLNRIIKAIKISRNTEIIFLSGKFSLWTGGFLKLLFKSKKVIAIIHGSELNAGGNFSKFLTRWSLNKVDHIIAVSTFTKSIALKINPKLKIYVINNGIEIKLNSSIKNKIFNQKNRLAMVSVGNLSYRKGQQNLIRALPLLKKEYPNIHYHCVGIPTEKENFEKLAEKLNVLEHITFHGVLSEIDKNRLLSECDLFCMLSSVLKNGDVEGFGIAILEANSMGLPAIGSNNSGIVDAIKNYFSGVLVFPEEEEEILKAVKLIVEDYDNYSRKAMDWSKNFQWNKVIKKYINVINS